MRRLLPAALLLAAACTALTRAAHATEAAEAQDAAGAASIPAVNPAETPAEQAATPSGPAEGWTLNAGPGVYVAPRYPGAAKSLAFPVIYQDIDYSGRFFSRGFDFLGVYAINNAVLQAGADLQLDPTWRHASDDARLHGLPNVNPALRARGFAQATVSLATLSVDLGQDISGQGQGLIANGDLYFSAPLGSWMLSAGPGLTWTNNRYMQTFFGVTAGQSAASGLPVHTVQSGVREWHANLAATGKLTERWSAVVSLTFARLVGDAGSSPVTASRRQLTSVLAVTYAFGHPARVQ